MIIIRCRDDGGKLESTSRKRDPRAAVPRLLLSSLLTRARRTAGTHIVWRDTINQIARTAATRNYPRPSASDGTQVARKTFPRGIDRVKNNNICPRTHVFGPRKNTHAHSHDNDARSDNRQRSAFSAPDRRVYRRGMRSALCRLRLRVLRVLALKSHSTYDVGVREKNLIVHSNRIRSRTESRTAIDARRWMIFHHNIENYQVYNCVTSTGVNSRVI